MKKIFSFIFVGILSSVAQAETVVKSCSYTMSGPEAPDFKADFKIDITQGNDKMFVRTRYKSANREMTLPDNETSPREYAITNKNIDLTQKDLSAYNYGELMIQLTKQSSSSDYQAYHLDLDLSLVASVKVYPLTNDGYISNSDFLIEAYDKDKKHLLDFVLSSGASFQCR